MADEAEIGGVALAWGAATDVGRVRALNEDSLLARPPVFAVADGMGGHDAGEVASALTVGRLEHLCGPGPTSIESVAAELQHVNSLLTDARPGGSDRTTMGTTAVGLVLVDHGGVPSWLVFNVGDSRAYRVAGGRMTQLSRDHSHVQDLVDRGEITQGDARRHPHRNVVTKALGADPELEADYWVRPLVSGDRFLLCSDGLTGEVEDETIESVLLDEHDPDRAVRALVALALESGGRDNVTAVVVDVVSVPAWDEPTTETRPGVDVPTGPRVVLDLSDGGIASVPRAARPDGAPQGPLRPADDSDGMIDAVPPTASSHDGPPAEVSGLIDAPISEVPIDDEGPARPSTPPPTPPSIITAMPTELAPPRAPDPSTGGPHAP